MNLSQALASSSARFPDKTALVCNGERMTYAELHHAASRVATTLQQTAKTQTPAQKHVESKQNIAIIAADHLMSLVLLFGAAQCGATITFIDPQLAATEIDYIVQDCGADLLFVSSAVAAKMTFSTYAVITDAASTDNTLPSFSQWCSSAEATATLAISASHSPCVLQLYTSGTTGRPKGVQLRDSSLFAIVENMRSAQEDWYLWQPSDVGISALPFFHIGGLWWATTAIAAGAKLAIMPRFHPSEYLQLITQEGVTRLALVPTMLMMVLAQPEAKSTDFSTVRQCLYGGSPISVSLLKRAQKRLLCDFVQIYGLTETGNTAICLRPEDHHHPHLLKAAGKPYPCVEVKCIDSEGNVLKTGEHGEICLKSPANMIGYRNMPEASAETLQDGWIHTGDVGYIDDDGYLFVCDRIKDMIICAGENIYSAEIETQFEDFPAIAQAVAIGIPDEQNGEQVKLLVQLAATSQNAATTQINEQLTEQHIMAFLQPRLAAHKLPRSVEFVSEFPRTAIGKVQRTKLRAPYWQGRARHI